MQGVVGQGEGMIGTGAMLVTEPREFCCASCIPKENERGSVCLFLHASRWLSSQATDNIRAQITVTPYLNHRINVNEIQTLNLVGFQAVWAFHFLQSRDNFFSQSTAMLVYLNESWSADIFCLMVEFSWNKRSTSTSTLLAVKHHVIPPTTWCVRARYCW